MYNGIGLATARGSGTNGYVVRNLSSLRPQNTKPREQFGSYGDAQRSSPAIKQPNQEILLHDRKRQIEVECLKLQMTLEDDGIPEAEIEAKVQQLRESLLAKLESVKAKDAKSLRSHETHQLSEAKQFENKKMMQALRIQETDYVEGAAFDQELQKKLKQERIAKREAEWAERQAQREKGRRNASPRRSRNTKRDRSPSEPRRSRTPDRKQRRTEEKRQPSKSPEKEVEKTTERGRSLRRSRSYSRSYSRSRSDSRSASPSRSRSDSRGRNYRHRSRSRSYSSHDSRSRSRSYSRSDRSYSSDSRSRSPPRRR